MGICDLELICAHKILGTPFWNWDLEHLCDTEVHGAVYLNYLVPFRTEKLGFCPLHYIGLMGFGGIDLDLEFGLGLINFNLDQNWEKLMVLITH